ncbi:MAG: prepilin peptidase [Methanoregulaceae archaeon]|nr:prepilin peptidase [Methanoregulaceae archaeon]
MAFTVTLCYASLLDIRKRRVPFRTWYPMLAVSIPFSAFFYGFLVIGDEFTIAMYLAAMAIVFSLVFYLFAYFNLFGGADAWALIFLSLCIPAFPLIPIFGVPPHAFFPFSVLINAVLLNLFTPVAIYFYNIKKGNNAPFPYLFIAYPVEGTQISESNGYVMEEFGEDNGVLIRRFIGIGEAIRGMVTGKGRIYTLDLRRNPEKYRKERELMEKAGRVWIAYGVPFIIPITAGFVTALLFGDIFFGLLKVVNGV